MFDKTFFSRISANYVLNGFVNILSENEKIENIFKKQKWIQFLIYQYFCSYKLDIVKT